MKPTYGYVLETESEFERLERQSNLPEYSFTRELADFSVPVGGVCLDAGCGSGVVSRYLASRFPQSKVIGCDASEIRVAQAKRAAEGYFNLSFQVGNLLQLDFPDSSFDSIVCRYVLQHVPSRQDQVVEELKRCLKPNGLLILIDADGIFTNLYPQSSETTRDLAKIQSERLVDFYSGRKIITLLHEKRLIDIDVKGELVCFRGAALEAELGLMRTRLESALPPLSKCLGSEHAARRFSQAFLETLQRPDSFYFHNLIIGSGRKGEL